MEDETHPVSTRCTDCGHDREQHDDADGEGCAGTAYYDSETNYFERCHCFAPPPSFDMWASALEIGVAKYRV
jgi:hypothetical protein